MEGRFIRVALGLIANGCLTAASLRRSIWTGRRQVIDN
ncbi:MAG: hypothetical protein JWR25_2241 [Noviherbaspirillum sp.]|nr:hypothetical protein [Noviherbaspirillum sp.]